MISEGSATKLSSHVATREVPRQEASRMAHSARVEAPKPVAPPCFSTQAGPAMSMCPHST